MQAHDIQFGDDRLPPRFWNKVRREINGCWIWTATRTSGYGQFAFGGRLGQSHRVAYSELVGPIPEGMVCDHLCMEVACVNPAHIEIVTQGENVKRGFAGLQLPREPRTHCAVGHALDEDNLYVYPTGYRDCRECRRRRSRKQKRKIKELRLAATQDPGDPQ